MRLEDLSAALHAAWSAARDRDLPPVLDENNHEPRPREEEFDYRIFAQSWPSTAGGMDAAPRAFGRAFCTRPTVVIRNQELWRPPAGRAHIPHFGRGHDAGLVHSGVSR